jgi:hypothetical protein
MADEQRPKTENMRDNDFKNVADAEEYMENVPASSVSAVQADGVAMKLQSQLLALGASVI